MPRSTPESIREYNQEFYQKNRVQMLQRRRELYAANPEFKTAIAKTSAKWYLANRQKISDARIAKKKNKNPHYISTRDMPPKKPKSARDLKIERIQKNLDKIEERARIFREKLLSENNIQNAPQTEEPANTTTDG